MLKRKYIKTFIDIIQENNKSFKNKGFEKGTWVSVKSKKDGLTYLGCVISHKITESAHNEILILDCENDVRLIQFENIKVCNLPKKLDLNIYENITPIIS
jgi:hypothetical protein